MTWQQTIQDQLADPIISETTLSGGSIASARHVTLASGKSLFVKTLSSHPQMFASEAAGLQELAKPAAIHIPSVIAHGPNFLILEYVPTGSPAPTYYEDFGAQLATMHRHTAPTFGFHRDTYCGSTLQPNTHRLTSWPDFYWTHRLEHQLRLAEAKGYADAPLRQAFHTLEARLHTHLAGSEEPPALIHGDLWSGNHLADASGHPTLIDPSVYYAHREAELGMCDLFGGFPPAFYRAYDATWPRAPGHQHRLGLYRLYHLMNHLNIFGTSYYQQALQTILPYTR